MKTRCSKILLLLSGLILLLTLLPVGNSFADFKTAAQNAIPNQYIVTYKSNVAANMTFGTGAMSPSAADVAGDLLGQFGVGNEAVLAIFENALEGFVGQMDEATAKALAKDPKVLLVEQDAMAYATDVQNNPTWGLDRIDQANLPLSKSYTYNTKAANVHAYIIDTGVNASHNEFSGRIGNGYDAVKDGGGTDDQHGHGTHVAGTVGGTQYGVAKGVTIHPVQALGSNGSAAWSVVIEAIDWVAQNHTKPAVANMSIGGSNNTSLNNAIKNCINAGVIFVVAAGNEGQDACNTSPGIVDEAITVAASDASDTRSVWNSSQSSNFGSCVDLWAPGSNIISASHTSNSGTTSMGGTSMASPHVAGVAALYLSNNTGASQSAVKSAILNAASTVTIKDGKGTPNKLLYSLFGGTPPPPPPPQDSELQNGKSVGVSGSKGEWKHFFINVPSGSSDLVMKLSGGSGDADLYTKFGSQPTSSSWDCRPYKNGNAEECTVASPNAGKYHVSLYAYNAFSSASLVATFKDGGTPPPPPPPSDNSCQGNCGGKAPGGCYCDSFCANYGDCCADKVEVCGNF